MKQLLLIGILSFLRLSGFSQEYAKFSYIQFYFTGQVAVPSKEFRQVVYNNFGNLGYGINTGLIVSPLFERRPSPFLIGLDFSYFTYGQEKDGATANTPRLKSTYNVYTWNGLVRIRPPLEKGALTPFADGLLGLKLYTTKTKVDKDLLDFLFTDNQAEVLNNVRDTGLSFGTGAGFYTNPRNRSAPSFSLRLLYLWGDEVEYVVKDSIKVDAAGSLSYETDRANTSMFLIQIGINAVGRKSFVQ